MKSAVIKRSIVIAGHKTSVSLEDAFWRGLKAIAHGRKINLFDLIASDVKNLYIGRFSGVAKRSSSPPRRTITRPGAIVTSTPGGRGRQCSGALWGSADRRQR
jgi:hypothetical protein